MVISHKTVLHRHLPQTPLAQSRGLPGSWLEEEHEYTRTAQGGERAGSNAPPQLQFMVVEGLQ